MKQQEDLLNYLQCQEWVLTAAVQLVLMIDFAKELEYFLLNPEAELPKADSYRETMNPVALVNDMIDPRNYAYYADRLAETGIRIGEFGARVLPALGQLTADLIQKTCVQSYRWYGSRLCSRLYRCNAI